MYRYCKVIDKITNENLYTNIDTELEGLETYRYLEIPEDNNTYIYDSKNKTYCVKPYDLQIYKDNANSVNTEKHLEFQRRPFIVHVVRDDNTELDMVLDCTDNTSDNILRASIIAERLGTVPFFDAFGNGSSKEFSEKEMSQVYIKFQEVLKPSFNIKGTTKDAINRAQSKEEIDTILANLKY